MTDYIDYKYINQLATRLELFKNKGDNLYNFRCPYCGDSHKHKHKARGYVYQNKGKSAYKCFNCGITASVAGLIKYVDPNLYKEYRLEKFADKKPSKRQEPVYKKRTFKFQKRPNYKNTPLGKLKSISQLPVNHGARDYVVKRKLPASTHFRLFYAPKFYEFAKQFAPDKFSEVTKDEPRLLIPYIDRDGNLVAFQGRAFGKSELRYVTVKIDEDAPKIFGLDTVNQSRPVYVVEGPLDSLFIDNAVAMGGADLTASALSALGTDDITFVFDNEPRNKEIIKRIDKIITLGYSVTIWPDYIEQKDINDMVLNGMDPEEIQVIISSNTFNGLSAKAKLAEWKRI